MRCIRQLGQDIENVGSKGGKSTPPPNQPRHHHHFLQAHILPRRPLAPLPHGTALPALVGNGRVLDALPSLTSL